MMAMARIIVVDDHDLVRAGLCRMLADIPDFEMVGEADSGEHALRLAQDLKPDVVLMDVRMPGIGGLEATRKLVRLLPECRVIALTACADDLYPQRLLAAGASGYLTKDAGMEEVVQAIRTVIKGKPYLSQQVAQQMALKPLASAEEGSSPFDDLSDRELQITLLIVQCHKVPDIAEKLFLSPKTVNTYRYRVFEKLGIESDVELALMAVRHGLLDVNASAAG